MMHFHREKGKGDSKQILKALASNFSRQRILREEAYLRGSVLEGALYFFLSSVPTNCGFFSDAVRKCKLFSPLFDFPT